MWAVPRFLTREASFFTLNGLFSYARESQLFLFSRYETMVLAKRALRLFRAFLLRIPESESPPT
jgi:hypothetical protein